MKSTIAEIKIELKDDTGLMTIVRPAFKNAISTEMWQAIPELLSILYTKGARSVIIRGSDSCFAAGADLQELKAIDSYQSAFKFWNSIKETLDFVHSFNIPTIALIEGPCLGGGCLLATACDIRLANFESSFAIPIARFGIVLDDETVARLVGLVGPAMAAELLFSGDTCYPVVEEALAIGLINRRLPAKDLEPKALNWQNIAGNAMLQYTKAKNQFDALYFREMVR
ncbi:MAG: enoyl-CoA hydratase/isomerase family protein [Cyanobacteriota/Melainabacteria group bacterium]